ncbi:MAG TPA: DUF4351 domain-containing protein [Steroidobacteraceae bacterium]|nr:DUF4351 domain-containing protein [Steroidobacteraceae bacterium]
MPSYLHELLLLLFRNRSESAADLLRKLDVELPEHDGVRAEPSDLSDLQPAAYRADLVFFLMRGPQRVLGIIVEVQLGRDEDKPYVWPAYIANLRVRHRCPVCLLIITIDEAVARWAGKSIELGPGTRCSPWVVGPSNTPAVTELRTAKENVELAVLSAIEHGQNLDIPLVARIASTAIVASADIDAERSRMYLDLILISLLKNAPEAVEATMNSLGYEYQSDFARRYFAEGKAEGWTEGKAEGRLELVLKQLALRFGPLTEVTQASLQKAQSAQLDAVAERVLTARTLEEALGPLA